MQALLLQYWRQVREQGIAAGWLPCSETCKLKQNCGTLHCVHGALTPHTQNKTWLSSIIQYGGMRGKELA